MQGVGGSAALLTLLLHTSSDPLASHRICDVMPWPHQVTALLDFEFSAFDWRAMELAVCLSKVRHSFSWAFKRRIRRRHRRHVEVTSI